MESILTVALKVSHPAMLLLNISLRVQPGSRS